jgi:hypothetical protein
MIEDQREIRRKKRVIDYAEKNGSIAQIILMTYRRVKLNGGRR